MHLSIYRRRIGESVVALADGCIVGLRRRHLLLLALLASDAGIMLLPLPQCRPAAMALNAFAGCSDCFDWCRSGPRSVRTVTSLCCDVRRRGCPCQREPATTCGSENLDLLSSCDSAVYSEDWPHMQPNLSQEQRSSVQFIR